jgi:hypothetical protein
MQPDTRGTAGILPWFSVFESSRQLHCAMLVSQDVHGSPRLARATFLTTLPAHVRVVLPFSKMTETNPSVDAVLVSCMSAYSARKSPMMRGMDTLDILHMHPESIVDTNTQVSTFSHDSSVREESHTINMTWHGKASTHWSQAESISSGWRPCGDAQRSALPHQ